MGFLLVLLLLAFVAWMVFTQVGGRQQISVSTEHDIAEARRIVGRIRSASPGPGRGPGTGKLPSQAACACPGSVHRLRTRRKRRLHRWHLVFEL